MFGRLLHFLPLNSSRVKIRNTNGRNSFVFSGVPSVSAAVGILDTALILPSI